MVWCASMFSMCGGQIGRFYRRTCHGGSVSSLAREKGSGGPWCTPGMIPPHGCRLQHASQLCVPSLTVLASITFKQKALDDIARLNCCKIFDLSWRNTPWCQNSIKQSWLDIDCSGLKAHEAYRGILWLATYFVFLKKDVHVPKWFAFTSCLVYNTLGLYILNTLNSCICF